jgi:outer membrane lipoprotein LolB
LLRVCFVFLLGALVTACATSPLIEVKYAVNPRAAFYRLDFWEFEGRGAVKSSSDSGSFNILWRHQGKEDNLRLSGFLGQGAVAIKVSGEHIEIDRGNGHLETSERPQELLERQLGFYVPVAALRFWVLGLPEAKKYFEVCSDGFRQAGWDVQYSQWMKTAGYDMPHKIMVNNEELKLKLVIDQWVLSRESEP